MDELILKRTSTMLQRVDEKERTCKGLTVFLKIREVQSVVSLADLGKLLNMKRN